MPLPVGVPALLEIRHVDQHDGRAIRRSRRLGVGRREDGGPDLVRPGRRPDQERLRQVRRSSPARASCRDPSETGSTPRRRLGRPVALPAERRRRHAVRPQGVIAGQRLARRDRRQLQRRGVRLHEDEERAAGGPGRHRPDGSALHHQSPTSATSTAISGAYDITLDGSNTPRFTWSADEAVRRRRRPADLLVDGGRRDRHAAVRVRRHRQRPVAVNGRQHAIQAAGRARHRHAAAPRRSRSHSSKTDGAGDDEKVTAFPAVAGDIVFFTTTTYKPTTPCVVAGCEPLCADVRRRRGLRRHAATTR